MGRACSGEGGGWSERRRGGGKREVISDDYVEELAKGLSLKVPGSRSD